MTDKRKLTTPGERDHTPADDLDFAEQKEEITERIAEQILGEKPSRCEYCGGWVCLCYCE